MKFNSKLVFVAKKHSIRESNTCFFDKNQLLKQKFLRKFGFFSFETMVEYFFVIITILLPFQFALNVGDNFDFAITRVLIPLVFLLWIVKGFARKKIWIPNKAEMWLAISFLFLSFLSLFFGRDASAGFRKLLYFFTIFPVFFVAADVLREEKWRTRALAAVVVGGTIAAAVGLSQFVLSYAAGVERVVKIWGNMILYFLGNSFGKIVAANPSWLVNIGGTTRMRAFGFFPDPHNFAFFVDLCLFAGLGYFFGREGNKSKILSGAGIILMIIAVGVSFSRGAYLGLIAGAIFFAIVFLKRTGALGKVIAVAGAIFVLVFMLNSNIISQRLVSSFNLREGSNVERYKNWAQAAEIVRGHPLGGVGLGNYARAIDPAATGRSSIYAHNLFLDIAAETGILNALIFLFLIFVSIWRNIVNQDMISLGLAAGLVAFAIHSIFDTALYSPQVLTILLVIIAYSVIASEAKQSRGFSDNHGIASSLHSSQ